MKDLIKPCHHCVSEDTVYKEVVIIGNGPSGILTSFLLSGYVPHLTEAPPEDLPIDTMLRARLRGAAGQSLLEVELSELAEGLEGRSQNPVPLLMDNLLNPCADLGLQADPLVVWKYDVDKQIEHVVLGKGPPGGSWHSFDPSVLTLSPSGWLALPPHRALPGHAREQRAPAGDVAGYYARYVRAQGLQRHFRNGVVVTGVTLQPGLTREPCTAPGCPLAARWCVTGYDTVSRRVFRYACSRVVLASGASDRPNTLPACGVDARALHDLSRRDLALSALTQSEDPVLVIGSGLSAADAVTAARRAGRRVAHVYRRGATALAALSPELYPDYCQVHKMMRDGPSRSDTNYIPLPQYALVEVTPLEDKTDKAKTDLDDITSRKRVKLLSLATNEVKELTVTVIFILIGSKPDLHFLPGNFDLSYIDINNHVEKREICTKCNNKHAAKRKMPEDAQCFLRNHWHYIKSVVGQGIQSCKSRYWDYINDTEINGNTDEKCKQPDCKRRGVDERNAKNRRKETVVTLENGRECKCRLSNPHSSGLGFGVDPKKPVDCRTNPIYIDKSTHKVINAPKGMYALGPLTSDNFVRFISGGAVAAVAHMWRERKLEMTD